MYCAYHTVVCILTRSVLTGDLASAEKFNPKPYPLTHRSAVRLCIVDQQSPSWNCDLVRGWTKAARGGVNSWWRSEVRRFRNLGPSSTSHPPKSYGIRGNAVISSRPQECFLHRSYSGYHAQKKEHITYAYQRSSRSQWRNITVRWPYCYKIPRRTPSARAINARRVGKFATCDGNHHSCRPTNSTNVIYKSYAVVTTTIPLRLDGRSTAYQRSSRSQWRNITVRWPAVSLTYLFI